MILSNFVVFEGIDGAGTSTQLERLRKKLATQNAVFTAEPTDGPVGVFMRSLLKGDATVSLETMARLFAADRQEHLTGKNGIIDSINTGKTVFCDRYIFSSLAYQDGGNDIRNLVKDANKAFPLPEIVFHFVIRPEVSLARITGRSVIEIYEKQDILERVASRYQDIFAEYATEHPDMKIIEIDAEESADVIEKIIWSSLSELPIIKTK